MCSTGDLADASRVLLRRVLAPLAGDPSSPPASGIRGIFAPGGTQRAVTAAVITDLSRRGVIRASLRPSPLDGEMWSASRPPGVVAIPRLAQFLPLERFGVTAERDTFARYSRHGAWIRKNMVLETLGSP